MQISPRGSKFRSSKFRRCLTFPLLAVAVMTVSGCANYYRVTDPSSGKIYYTKDINSRDNGAISLKDAATGDQVTLQNSQVSKVSKEEFETNRAGKH